MRARVVAVVLGAAALLAGPAAAVQADLVPGPAIAVTGDEDGEVVVDVSEQDGTWSGSLEVTNASDAVVELALVRIGARRSSWNAADLRGECERIVVDVGVIADGVVRRELTEDLAARAVAASRPLPRARSASAAVPCGAGS